MNTLPFVSNATRITPELLLFDNSYRGYSFPRHFHETYLVELVEGGTEHFYCNGSYYNNVQKDSLVLINPGEVHTGGDKSHLDGFQCKVFYPGNEAWQLIAGESFRSKSLSTLRFTTTVINNSSLSSTMRQMIAAAGEGNELLQQELYQQLMIGLMQQHMEPSFSFDENVQQYTLPLKRSLEYINDNIGKRLLLDDIARAAFISPFHFLRLFKKFMGMTLHQYVLALRIDKAKNHLLQKGCSIESAFHSVGFADQSHFTKVFRKMTGLTPGQYKAIMVN